MRAKKAFGIHIIFLLIAFLLGIGFFLVARYSQSQQFDSYIGQYNFYLKNAERNADKALYFVQQSAENNLPQTIYDLAQNGGIADIDGIESIDSSGADLTGESDKEPTQNKCGKFNDAAVWFEINKNPDGKYEGNSCSDYNSLKNELAILFNDKLNGYLLGYPDNIPIDNYDYEVRGSLEILGRALSPLKFSIVKGEAKDLIIEPTVTPEGIVDFTGTELCKKGAVCRLAEEAYSLLLRAQETAVNKSRKLEVSSAYRSMEEQAILYRINNEDSSIACRPSPACPHFSGKAVDIRFKGKTAYTMSRQEWLLLHEIMSEAGWVRYGDEKDSTVGEPWHFECCGTKRYQIAQQTGVTAVGRI